MRVRVDGADLLARRAARRSTGAASTQVEVVVDRVDGPAATRGRGSPTASRTPWRWAAACCTWPIRDDDVPEPQWPVEVHSQHLACDECGRSFEPLSPHHFSFNSSLGWCPACEGLGTQTGANPAALLRDPKLTLAEGAVALWPDVDSPVFARDARRRCPRGTGMPIDVPFDQLDARHRRLIMHGTGEQWFDVAAARAKPTQGERRPLFRFQYKGLYPALDEAVAALARASARGWSTWSTRSSARVCGGSRLRDDAAAVRLRGRTIDELCRMPLGELLRRVRRLEARRRRERKIAGELVREIRNRAAVPGRRRAGLPDARPAGAHALRRRDAADPAGQPGRQRAVRRALRARRADDRPAPPRQPPAARRPAQAPRPGQHAAGGRARPRGGRRAPTSCSTSARPPAATADEIVAQRHARSRSPSARASVTGPYLSGKKAIPVPTNRRMAADATADRAGQRSRSRRHGRSGRRPADWLEIIGARHNNLKNIDVRIPAGHVDRRHRRQRQRQEFAGRRRALQRAGPHAASGQDRRRAPTTRSAASSRSTR